jgi:hypothetical protein
LRRAAERTSFVKSFDRGSGLRRWRRSARLGHPTIGIGRSGAARIGRSGEDGMRRSRQINRVESVAMEWLLGGWRASDSFTLPGPRRGSPVEGAHNAERAPVDDVGVDHRRSDVLVAEQRLDGADIGATLQEAKGVGKVDLAAPGSQLGTVSLGDALDLGAERVTGRSAGRSRPLLPRRTMSWRRSRPRGPAWGCRGPDGRGKGARRGPGSGWRRRCGGPPRDD